MQQKKNLKIISHHFYSKPKSETKKFIGSLMLFLQFSIYDDDGGGGIIG